MNRRRQALLALGLCALDAQFGAIAQPPGKVRRIGFLASRSRSTPSNPDVYYDAFLRGMRELGYVEGKNLVIEWRFADQESERLPALAADLVRLKVEVIVTHGSPGTQAAQRATSTIPIVTAAVGDPIVSGFTKSLARPGANITGLSLMNTDLSSKHLELLKIMVPTLSRVGILADLNRTGHRAILKDFQAAARQLRISILPADAHTLEDIERAFAAMRRERADAVVVLAESLFIGQRRQIVGLAAKNRLPSMFYYREDTEAGGLMSYGTNATGMYHRAATYVDKILKGARPGELPFEQPMIIHLAINRKTAQALGITIPPEMLLRADEVIE